MYRTPSLLILAVITSLLTTAAAQAQQEQLQGWPDWVQEAMQTEIRRMKFRTVETPDDAFRSKLPGKANAPEAFDGGWYFVTDFKAESPLECYIYTESMDLASLTNQLAEINIETVAETYGTVADRRVFHTSAGEVAGMPYLALEWIYAVQTEDSVLAAFTKVRATTKGDISIACAHNYLGYRDSFARAFSEFVTNLEYDDSTAAPYFEEIAHIDSNSVGTGIAYSSYTLDEEGDIRMYSLESTLIAADPATLITTDSYSISYSTPEGELINAFDISVENSEISSNMELRLNDAGNWVSSGTLQGKDIETELDSSQSPTSELQQVEMARTLFSGNDTQANAYVWIPGIDPTQLLEATMTRDDDTVERQAIMTLGPMSYTGQFDVDGNLVTADLQIGPASIAVRRIWTNGSFRQ